MASNKLSYGEVRTIIHRVNERMRYTANKYGIDSTVTKEMAKEMHRLIVGTDVRLTQNKKGIMQIGETEQNINVIMRDNKLPKEASKFREVAENTSPKKIFDRQVKQYLGRKPKKAKVKDIVERLNEVKPHVDTFTKLLDKLLEKRIIGSSVVNTIHRDDEGSKKLATEIYEKFISSGYSLTNEDDLYEIGNYILNDPVANAYVTPNQWGMGSHPTIQANIGGTIFDVPENPRSFLNFGPLVGDDDKTIDKQVERARSQRRKKNPFGRFNNEPFERTNKPLKTNNKWNEYK